MGTGAGGESRETPAARRACENHPVSKLADAVLPLIRTRGDVWRYKVANAHGIRMHRGIDRLEAAIPTEDPATWTISGSTQCPTPPPSVKPE
jgi:hypothetical protein